MKIQWPTLLPDMPAITLELLEVDTSRLDEHLQSWYSIEEASKRKEEILERINGQLRDQKAD